MNIIHLYYHEHFSRQDLSGDIQVFVLVNFFIFGIGHYRTHLCFTNTSYLKWFLKCEILVITTRYRLLCFYIPFGHRTVILQGLAKKNILNPYNRCAEIVLTPRNIHTISGSVSGKRSPREVLDSYWIVKSNIGTMPYNFFCNKRIFFLHKCRNFWKGDRSLHHWTTLFNDWSFFFLI